MRLSEPPKTRGLKTTSKELAIDEDESELFLNMPKEQDLRPPKSELVRNDYQTPNISKSDESMRDSKKAAFLNQSSDSSKDVS